MFIGNRSCWTTAGGLVAVTFTALAAWPAEAQVSRGPRDFSDGADIDRTRDGDRDRYGRQYRDQVFSRRFVDDRENREKDVARRRARFDRDNSDHDASFSEAYPYVPRSRRSSDQEWRDESPALPDPRVTSRYRRPPDDGLVRNDYAGAPVYRHYYGGEDRYDSPDYLDSAGRASALANGYSRRGVEEFHDWYGRGVRTNDVYPLQRNVDPRRYRGRDLNGSVTADDEDSAGARDLEGFVRSELSVRPGANLRVSSTGTYTFKNYLDQGNQVHARFRQPVHRRWEYLNP
ncbi:MAG TPA: hypothetical protein VG826_17935 [Pirellulales bacterium]|nr:hypothetical protein [Pirellulales bacterium]